MLGKKKESGLGCIETIIGVDTVFRGTISSKSAVRIDGKLEGNIAEAQGVVIGDKGMVEGDINAGIVVVGGKVTGNITATQNLEILPKAQVYGDLHCAMLVIGEGATFDGSSVMTAEKDKIIEMNVSNGAQRRK